MLLDFEDRPPVTIKENSGLDALSLEADSAIKSGNVSRAGRLLAGKLALRALIIDACKCASSNVCLKCNLVVDEGDLCELLNFFALKLLEFRLKLYKEKSADNIDIKVGFTLVGIYRRLIALAFQSIKAGDSLGHFVEVLGEDACSGDVHKSDESIAFFADGDYRRALNRIFDASKITANFTDRRSVVGILRGGRQIAHVSEAKFSDGDCFMYAQNILYRLLFAHDSSQQALFAGPRRSLLLCK